MPLQEYKSYWAGLKGMRWTEGGVGTRRGFMWVIEEDSLHDLFTGGFYHHRVEVRTRPDFSRVTREWMDSVVGLEIITVLSLTSSYYFFLPQHKNLQFKSKLERLINTALAYKLLRQVCQRWSRQLGKEMGKFKFSLCDEMWHQEEV